VQQYTAGELVTRSDTARAFLIADLLFPFVYAGWVGLAMLRVGRRLGGTPRWVLAGVAALALAGLCDLAENALLLVATGGWEPRMVDLAHTIAIPKLALFVIGAVVALATLAWALRRREPAGSAGSSVRPT
jgi:hypothetical protein